MLQVYSNYSPSKATSGPEDDTDDSHQHLGGGHHAVYTKPDILHHAHGTVSQR